MDSPSFVALPALAFRNKLKYRNYDFKRFNVDDLATSYKNLVYFCPVTPEQICTPLVDQQFGYVRLAAPLVDLAGMQY